MDKYWRAVYVKSRTEKKVLESLLLNAVEAYTPIIRTMRQWSDRKKIVELPLINGYVFVRISDSEIEKVLQTKGVVSFVRNIVKIAIIRPEEIERLKQLVSLGYQLEAHPINKIYKQGDKVKISSGVLRGVEGFVTDAGGNKQIEIVLESIGHSITMRLPKDLLQPVNTR